MEQELNKAEDYCELGKSLMLQGKLDESLAVFAAAIKIRPTYAEALFYFGNALFAKGHARESVIAYRHSIATGKVTANVFNNLAAALTQIGELDQSLAASRRAIALQGDFPEAYVNLGNVLQALGQYEQAAAAYRRALSLKSDLDNARLCLSLLQLKMGDLANGWPAFESRLRCLKNLFSAELPQPFWDGSPLAGRRILLRAEQGFGDTIQFVRFLPQVAAMGGRILLQCQDELHRLLQGQLGIEKLFSQADAPSDFDVQYPLMSLAGLFAPAIESIPAKIPYLFADSSRADYWRDRLGRLPGGLKVGLVWAGRPTNKDDHNRSISLEAFDPLRELPNVQFLSLQKGPAGAQVKNLPEKMKVLDWTDELVDFAETAAMLVNLDLVITVDTAVAHLAGALGRPTWLLLPFSPDWRWMLVREDSPWYPTMRLFRQTKLRDWPGVMQRVAAELSRIAKQPKRNS